MKKIVFSILIFLIPIFIKADYSVTNYYVDITVLENGDLNVIEAFSMSGSYNGFEKIINYKGNYSGYKGNKIASVDDISLYDAEDVILNEIRSIDFSDDFKNILVNSNLFTKVNTANKGEYGVYTISKRPDGETYTIYNPSKMNKDFYISYTLKNMVIVHDDVSELAMNVFNAINEKIDYLEIYIHIPTNNKLLKAWAHGKNDEVIDIVDNQTIKIIVDNLKNNHLDFRIVFDKEAILEVNKKSNDIVLDKIVEIEKKLQNEANINKDEQYELLKEEVYNSVLQVEKTHDKTDYEYAIESVKKLRDDSFKTELLVRLMNVESKVERNYIITKVIFTSIMGIILIGILIILYQIYKKYNKEYQLIFKEKYFIDIPSNYSPATVSYLMRRRINNNDLSASILRLINNKNISFEQTKNKKDYKFIKLSLDNLSVSDERLIKFVFEDSEEITLSKLNKRAKNDYNNFINQYSNWFNSVIHEATNEKFYEDLLFYKIFGISYSIVGIVISALLLDKPTYFSPIITILICILAILYFSLFYKRTKKGNEQYSKWIALKRFMIDFSNIDEKKLPEIRLWDKYLMYAISLGCVEKLSKNMKSKIDQITDNVSDIVSFQFLINFYKIIDYSIKYSIEIAYSAKNSSDVFKKK